MNTLNRTMLSTALCALVSLPTQAALFPLTLDSAAGDIALGTWSQEGNLFALPDLTGAVVTMLSNTSTTGLPDWQVTNYTRTSDSFSALTYDPLKGNWYRDVSAEYANGQLSFLFPDDGQRYTSTLGGFIAYRERFDASGRPLGIDPTYDFSGVSSGWVDQDSRFQVTLSADYLPTFQSVGGSLWRNGGDITRIQATITEVTPVPLPAAAWLFVSAVAGLSLTYKGQIQKKR